MEEWRDVEGYEGLYQVSNEGRVRSLDRTIIKKNGVSLTVKGKIIKPRPIKNGYFRIVLCKDGVYTDKLVHVLVGKMFIPNPNNYDVVHHINYDKTDNNVENLKWMSYQQHIEEHKAKKVCQYTLEGKLVKTWDSTKDTIENSFCPSGVAACCRGEINTYKGFIWRYA